MVHVQLITLILNSFSRNPRSGEIFLKASLVFFTVLSLFIHIKNEYEMKYDVIVLLFTSVYLASWVRIGPYLIGMLSAILLQKNGGKLQISQVRIGAK